jgi:hypothetical protein
MLRQGDLVKVPRGELFGKTFHKRFRQVVFACSRLARSGAVYGKGGAFLSVMVWKFPAGNFGCAA